MKLEQSPRSLDAIYDALAEVLTRCNAAEDGLRAAEAEQADASREWHELRSELKCRNDAAIQARKPRNSNTKGKRWRQPRKLPGGRLDESYSLVRKSLQELDRATGGQSDKWGTAEAWEHLYAAEEILGKALKRAV